MGKWKVLFSSMILHRIVFSEVWYSVGRLMKYLTGHCCTCFNFWLSQISTLAPTMQHRKPPPPGQRPPKHLQKAKEVAEHIIMALIKARTCKLLLKNLHDARPFQLQSTINVALKCDECCYVTVTCDFHLFPEGLAKSVYPHLIHTAQRPPPPCTFHSILQRFFIYGLRSLAAAYSCSFASRFALVSFLFL
jgi:hypothetical protein